MFLRKAALRPVPDHAVVPDSTIEEMEESLGDDKGELQDMLDRGYRLLDQHQPSIAGYAANQVAELKDELAQSLGYFLAVTVFLAFHESFGANMEPVDDAGLLVALGTLSTDEQIRAEDPLEVLESDDVVAMGQPALLDYVQHHMREALKQSESDSNVAELDQVYRAILVEVIALSHCVASGGSEKLLD